MRSLKFHVEDGEIIRGYDTPFDFKLIDQDQIRVMLRIDHLEKQLIDPKIVPSH